MSVLQTLKTKPWLRQEDTQPACSGSTFDRPREIIGLRFFLVVASALFFLFIMGYRMRMGFEDWRPTPEPWQLWLNTAMLILSSVAFQWARVIMRRTFSFGDSSVHNNADGQSAVEEPSAVAQLQRVARFLWVAGFFAFAFLAGQLWTWQQLNTLGYFVTSNPASSFFYLITAIHGLHLLGGLVAWWRSVWRLQQQVAVPESEGIKTVHMSVELCAIYWHYLLAVWVVLFYLLATT